MKNKCLTLTVGAFSLFTSLSAFADYTYTFTSNPLSYLYNTFQTGQLSTLDSDDRFKFVITTEQALQTNLQYSAADLLSMGTMEASLGKFKNTFDLSDFNADSDSLRVDLTAFDENGTPSAWFFQLPDESFKYGKANLDTLTFYSRDYEEGGSFSQLQAMASHEPFEYLYAESIGGKWSVSEISSPVPEAPEYAMFLAGLGLIGFISRKRKS
jgi:hypothetical protein